MTNPIFQNQPPRRIPQNLQPGVQAQQAVATTAEQIFSPDLIGLVDQFLDPQSQREMLTVSWEWHEGITHHVCGEEFKVVQLIVKALFKHLSNKLSLLQKKQLLDIQKDRTIFGLNRYIQVRVSIAKTKEKLLDILKNLRRSDLNRLEGMRNFPTSPFFADLFQLAKIYRKIEKSQFLERRVTRPHRPMISLWNHPGQLRDDISLALDNAKFRDRPFEFVMKCATAARPDINIGQERLFEEIGKTLISLGPVEKSIRALSKIGHLEIKDWTFSLLSEAYIRLSHLDLAEKMALEIQNEELKVAYLSKLCAPLVKAGQWDRAVELARNLAASHDSIAGEPSFCLLNEIILELFQLSMTERRYPIWLEQIEKILEISRDIPIENRDDFIGQVCEKSSSRGIFDMATNLVDEITNINSRSHVCCLIFENAIEQSQRGWAIDILDKISLSEEIDSRLYDFVKWVCDFKDLALAIHLTGMIQKESYRTKAQAAIQEMLNN